MYTDSSACVSIAKMQHNAVNQQLKQTSGFFFPAGKKAEHFVMFRGAAVLSTVGRMFHHYRGVTSIHTPRPPPRDATPLHSSPMTINRRRGRGGPEVGVTNQVLLPSRRLRNAFSPLPGWLFLPAHVLPGGTAASCTRPCSGDTRQSVSQSVGNVSRCGRSK